MYICKLTIQNLKLLNDVEVSFMRGDSPRLWTVLVGENGLCKTTILQAIALAASGPDRSNQLVADTGTLPDRRNTDRVTEIQAEFEFGPTQSDRRTYPLDYEALEYQEPTGAKLGVRRPRQIRSRIWLNPGWKVFLGSSEYADPPVIGLPPRQTVVLPQQRQDPLQTARAKGLPYWFVAGYGVTRSLPAPMSTERLVDPVLERVLPLFDRGRILGTGFTDQFDNGELYEAYKDQLLTALIAASGLLPRVMTITFSGSKRARKSKSTSETQEFGFQAGDDLVLLPATWLSHGYQSIIAWVSDLIGHVLLDAGHPVRLNEMEGLVLIDELDLHLHPRWQAGLIRALKATFPRMQFVATTHSPMLLPGLESDEILHVFQDSDGNVQVKAADQSPALMTGSEIYQSFFGIDRLYPVDLGEDLRNYGYLSSDPNRTDQEEHEMRRLLEKLKKAGIDPGWEPTSRNHRRPPTRRNKT